MQISKKSTSFIKSVIIHPLVLLGLLFVLITFINYRDVHSKTQLESEDFVLATVLPATISQPATPGAVITVSQLNTQNGKEGNKCYVAVDNVVYQVIQGRLWNNGVHDSSNMQAYCGRDLSGFIDKAPHGRDKLKELYIVGTLK
jgi:predicted heme/steroid binding protein